MKKFMVGLLVVMGLFTVAQPAVAKPAAVDCTVLIYQPVTFWTRGAWRPKSVPHGWSTEDWFWHCSGRMRPAKRGPKRPNGPWGATIHLNINNCTYQADEAWLRDSAGWRNATIYVSPWPA